MEEIDRIREEAERLGHQISIVDFSNFHFTYVDGERNFHPEIPECNMAIVRGMFATMKSLEILKEYLKLRKIKVFDNNLFKHKYSINKVYDISKLILHNVPTPDFYHARSYDMLYDFCQKMIYPAVLKTAGTGKGVSIWKLKNFEDAKKYIEPFQKEGKKARKLVIQSFVDYKYDLRVLVMGKKMFAMRRIPKKGDFRANYSLGGSVELFRLNKDIKKLAKQAMKAVDLSMAGVDVLVDENDNLSILEVNHTPGFVGMEKATGVNIGEIFLKYAIKNARKIR